MKYLLDTNIISETRRPRLTNSGVVAWITEVEPDDLLVSVLTVLELERGTLAAERHQPDLGRALRWWMTELIIPNYAARAIPVNARVALRAATYIPTRKDLVADHLIAATAAEHDLVLVTRNVKDMTHPGVSLLNPFS